jgi:inosose dehydratase
MAKLQFNGARVVVYGECAGTIQGQIDTPLARRPASPSRAMEGLWRAAQCLRRTSATTYGITLAYHHHMGAYVESPTTSTS